MATLGACLLLLAFVFSAYAAAASVAGARRRNGPVPALPRAEKLGRRVRPPCELADAKDCGSGAHGGKRT